MGNNDGNIHTSLLNSNNNVVYTSALSSITYGQDTISSNYINDTVNTITTATTTTSNSSSIPVKESKEDSTDKASKVSAAQVTQR